jgi:hypothetical protein
MERDTRENEVREKDSGQIKCRFHPHCNCIEALEMRQ